MFKSITEYIQNRYSPLEANFLNDTRETLAANSLIIRQKILGQLQKAIAAATEVQSFEKIPCAYISISFFSTSVFNSSPHFQIDFYDECWFYGVKFSSSRLDAVPLFSHWNDFKTSALDSRYYDLNQILPLEIMNLFWGTLDKLILLFTDFIESFIDEIKRSNEFAALVRTNNFYVTCGIDSQWQKKIYCLFQQ